MMMSPAAQFYSVLDRDNAVSEPPDISEVQHEGINLRFADFGAVQLHIAVNVDPAQVGSDGGIVRQGVIQTDLHRDAPAVINVEITQWRAFVEEVSVVQACADIGLPGTLRWKVIVERQGGRKLFDIACVADPGNIDVMLEGPCGQKLDADIVAHEILGGKGRAHTVADICFAPGKCPIVRFGQDGSDTQTDGPVPLGLGKCAGRGKKTEKYCHTTFFHGDVLMRINMRILLWQVKARYDLDQLNACIGAKKRGVDGQTSVCLWKGIA